MEKNIFSKVFLWMFIGLILTFGVGIYISNNPTMLENLFVGSRWIILAIIQIVVVMFLSFRINKLSPMSAKILFLVYSLITGLTFSTIFVVYQVQSIIYVFLLSAIIFLIFGLIGYFTRVDLTKLGTILMMMLIGVLLSIIINLFFNNQTFDLVTNIICLIVFLGYTAYDIQKIKNSYYIINKDNASIFGALQLYIDFINIFLRLLRLFGKTND